MIQQNLIFRKCIGEGEYVVHEGDVGEGVYFIWEGEVSVLARVSGSLHHCINSNVLWALKLNASQAEVSGPVDSEDPDFHLSKYDYFGHGKIKNFLVWLIGQIFWFDP